MITSERCEDIGSWLSENAQKETPEYTSTMAVRLYALTHSFSRRFGPRAPLNVRDLHDTRICTDTVSACGNT